MLLPYHICLTVSQKESKLQNQRFYFENKIWYIRFIDSFFLIWLSFYVVVTNSYVVNIGKSTLEELRNFL